MPGHAGGGQGLLSDQQELRQRRAGPGTTLLWGQDDGGITVIYTYYFIMSKKVYLIDYTKKVVVAFQRALGLHVKNICDGGPCEEFIREF